MDEEPKEAAKINVFPTHLAVAPVSAFGTRTNPPASCPFSVRKVLKVDPGHAAGVVRVVRSKRLPVVLTREEVHEALGSWTGHSR